MKTEYLDIGKRPNGKPFQLPFDTVVQTFALLGIRRSGKSTTAAVMAEEMCKNGLLWNVLDPVGIWWGMRAGRDGKPGGYPVVVIGGEHADIPLEKGAGQRIAEALMSQSVCAVIDVSMESKTVWRRFLTDYCLTLLKIRPDVPRHLFLEEAPEFVPQRTKVKLTAECKEAVERFIRLGGNMGYGSTLISQRAATVDKDVLTQCENIFVLRMSHKLDRKALQEWLDQKDSDPDSPTDLRDLAKLKSGTGYFWSPQWLEEFTKVHVRDRETFHPGATRKVGQRQTKVTLSSVESFVDNLRRKITSTSVSVPEAVPSRSTATLPIPSQGEPQPQPQPQPSPAAAPAQCFSHESEIADLQRKVTSLESELSTERRARLDGDRRLQAVKKYLQPQYDSLKALFEEMGSGSGNGADMGLYAEWLDKAGKPGTKRRRMLEVILERGELTKAQLRTLSGAAGKSSSFRENVSWMRRNGLAETDGDIVRRKALV